MDAYRQAEPLPVTRVVCALAMEPTPLLWRDPFVVDEIALRPGNEVLALGYSESDGIYRFTGDAITWTGHPRVDDLIAVTHGTCYAKTWWLCVGDARVFIAVSRELVREGDER